MRLACGAASGLGICAWNFRREWLSIGPNRAIFEVLLLPDGHGAFERVDKPAAGIKGGGAMSGGDRDQHAGLADLEPPQPVDNGYVANLKLLQSLLARDSICCSAISS